MFKRTVSQCKNQIGGQNQLNSLNFNNPLLKSPLVLSKTYPIYPDNKEVYIEFNTDVLEKIHRSLTKVKLVSSTNESESDQSDCSLELSNQDQVVVTIHSDKTMIHFLEFLLKNVINLPISKVLQGVQAPSISDLKAILGSYQTLQKCMLTLDKSLPLEIDRLINSTILDSNIE